MIITEVLERNAELYGDEVALVELNPTEWKDHRPVTWKEYNLIEAAPAESYRREITWAEFDAQANRFANLLLTRGIQKGDKVAILLMNSLEWLPIYFGVLKAGALAVPMNYRYAADEIEYCLKLADAETLIFGPEFIGRVESIFPKIKKSVHTLFYVGDNTPTFADSYNRLINYCSRKKPDIEVTESDEAAIYFSSGTTGFPKAILHSHAGVMSACETEQNHHSQTRDDVFLCIPPLYHTGAKMHWFGSLLAGSRAVLLRGIKPEW
ncbi:MAG: acyl--CoA ligase, partial [Clostridia bacterium]|nr:acyl--CoA ligase [Clostridia bacterium]